MKTHYVFALAGVALTSFVLFLIVLVHGNDIPLLIPSGAVGLAERDLMLRATFLMLIVVIPVVLLAIFIAWQYREGNTKATYTPNWEQSRMEELIWWSIPFEIVLVLAALTWTSTHELDPSRALYAKTPPMTIEVVALPWKWLFIYPQEGIASLNELALPVDRPVEFHITADAPMNSFWIPALGGQMYAMTGMTTVLHLIANKSGDFTGRSANYSGEGFAQMQFTVHALDEASYEAWVQSVRKSPATLTQVTYGALRKPGDAGPVQHFGAVTMSFADIVDTYMTHVMPNTGTAPMMNMDMSNHP